MSLPLSSLSTRRERRNGRLSLWPFSHSKWRSCPFGKPFARYWRRLAKLRTWSPVQDMRVVGEVLDNLAGRKGRPNDGDISDWLTGVRRRANSSPLLRAVKAGRDWMNLPGAPRICRQTGPSLLRRMEAVWKEKGYGRSIPLPFWSAPTAHHHKLSMKAGLEWTIGALDCIARSARIGLDELERLQAAEAKIEDLGRTKRSMLPAALGYTIRMPIIRPRAWPTG